jgi:hypothetical protein
MPNATTHQLFDELMCEDPLIAQRRKDLRQMLEVLKRACEVLNEVCIVLLVIVVVAAANDLNDAACMTFCCYTGA